MDKSTAITRLDRLKSMLDEFTVAIECADGKIITDKRRGVAPALELCLRGVDLSGAVVADRVVGKAVALLYVYLKVATVHARVISQPALKTLTENGVECSYDQLTAYIINRKGDGRCPMEEAVSSDDSPEEAIKLIQDKQKELAGGSMKKLGFGLMRLPLKNADDRTSVDLEQVCKMVDAFIERGFTYFDTAYMYHDFKSELFVKEALVKRYDRDKFLLADKLPSMFLKQEGDPERFFNEQLEKCGVEYFDYYLIHCLDKENYKKAERFDAFGFAERMKAEGKIKKLGFSFHDTAEMLDKIISEHKGVDFVQLQLNYLDWEDGGVQSRACWEVARAHGKDIVVMEPIKGGTLANLPKEAEDELKRADASLSPAGWALKFVASLDGVIMILSGMSNLAQLDENTRLFDGMTALSAEHKELLLGEVTRIIKKPQSIACTGCSYCTDGCPKKIDIPTVFSAWNGALMDDGMDEDKGAEAYERAIRGRGKASECLGCKKCEGICPQKLPIVKNLKKIAEKLEK